MEEKLNQAVQTFDDDMTRIVGCRDNACEIRRWSKDRGGSGTHYGCGCVWDVVKVHRYMLAVSRLRTALENLEGEEKPDDGKPTRPVAAFGTFSN